MLEGALVIELEPIPELNACWLLLDRPRKRNAIDEEMLQHLERALTAVEGLANLATLLIASSTPGIFVAGGDIRAMHDLDSATGRVFVEAGHAFLHRVANLAMVTIAVVDGPALGGGTELALACDMVYASDRATFGLPEVSLGLFPGWGGTQRLQRTTGRLAANELIFTAQRISSDVALQIGLVNRCYPTDVLRDEVLSTAKLIGRNSLTAVRAAKRAMLAGAQMPLDAALQAERVGWVSNLANPDRKEGLSAFLDRREPRFAHMPHAQGTGELP
jgi:enoyl-CoA hydratase/carnithine racemase